MPTNRKDVYISHWYDTFLFIAQNLQSEADGGRI